MSSRKLSLRALFVAFALLAVGLVGGCGSKEDSQSNPSSSASSPVTTAGKVRVEFRPPESGERLRRHIYDTDGVTEVELQTEYTDGRMSYQYFRKDGTLKEHKLTHPGLSVLKRHAFYDSDGKTVLSEETYRLNGTLETQVKRLDGSTYQTTTYRADGKQVKSIKVARSGSNSFIEITHYRKDGSLWVKDKWLGGADREVEYYGISGKLEQRRVFRANDDINITFYRADGTVSYRQSWKLVYGGWWYRTFALEWLEEYQANGTTLARRLVFNYDGKTIRESHLYDLEGSKVSVKYYRADGTLERENFLDKAGKVTKSEPHSVSEGLRETVDTSKLAEPGFDDPSNERWRGDDD